MHQSVYKSTFFLERLIRCSVRLSVLYHIELFFQEDNRHKASSNLRRSGVKYAWQRKTSWHDTWGIDAAKGASLLSAWCPKQLLRDCAWCAHVARIAFETSADLPDEIIFGQRCMNLAGQVFRGYVLAFCSHAVNVDQGFIQHEVVLSTSPIITFRSGRIAARAFFSFGLLLRLRGVHMTQPHRYDGDLVLVGIL